MNLPVDPDRDAAEESVPRSGSLTPAETGDLLDASIKIVGSFAAGRAAASAGLGLALL